MKKEVLDFEIKKISRAKLVDATVPKKTTTAKKEKEVVTA
jgi:hypothetical protein